MGTNSDGPSLIYNSTQLHQWLTRLLLTRLKCCIQQRQVNNYSCTLQCTLQILELLAPSPSWGLMCYCHIRLPRAKLHSILLLHNQALQMLKY